MKRFSRWLFNGLVTTGLLVCLTTIVLWAISYWHMFYAQYGRPVGWICVMIDRGLFNIQVVQGDTELRGLYFHEAFGDSAWGSLHAWGQQHGLIWQCLGQMGFAERPSNYLVGTWPNIHANLTGTEIYFPMWFVITCGLIPPTILINRNYRHRCREHAGLCSACGYDLRATSDRCPECGNIPKKII